MNGVVFQIHVKKNQLLKLVQVQMMVTHVVKPVMLLTLMIKVIGKNNITINVKIKLYIIVYIYIFYFLLIF